MSRPNIQWPDGECYSVSQVKAYLLCARLWYFQSILKLRDPSSEAQEWGTAAHDTLWQFLLGKVRLDKIDSPHVQAAARQLDRLRGKVKPADLERTLIAPLAPGKWFVGFVDWVVWGNGQFEDQTYQLEIGDHKSHHTLELGASEERLGEDLQLCAYAYVVGMERGTPPTHVRLTHNQFARTGPAEARTVSVVVPWEKIREGWTFVVDTVKRMSETRHAESAHYVPRNDFACAKYGGCKQAARCALADRHPNRYRGIDTMATMINRAKPAATPAAKPGPKPLAALAAARGAVKATPAKPAPAPAKPTAAPKPVVKARPKPAPEPEPEYEPDTSAETEEGQPEPEPEYEPDTSAETEEGNDGDQHGGGTRDKSIVILYLDCVPLSSPSESLRPVDLSEIMAPLAAAYVAEFGEEWTETDYAKGMGRMMRALASADLPRAVTIDRMTRVGREAAAVLRPLAINVVAGLR